MEVKIITLFICVFLKGGIGLNFIKSKKTRLTYQLLVLCGLIIWGIVTYPSQLADMIFFTVAIGIFMIIDTLNSNRKGKARLRVAVFIGIVSFVLVFLTQMVN